ncbi:beta-phosphoglucomutase family hydrolase [soil metagenome]
MKKAFIFDLNGTIIDDMNFHVEAWSQLLNGELNATMDYNAVKAQMYGKNSELLIRVFGPDHFTDEQMQELSMKKEIIYQAIYKPHLKLIDGLSNFLEQAYQQGIPMAIGSAAIMFNINFILDNLGIRKYFGALVSADHVATSKPDPETFIQAAEILGTHPNDCIVFEDAPKGVETAINAGMKVVVILSSLHAEFEFDDFDNIICFIKSYDQITPATLVG